MRGVMFGLVGLFFFVYLLPLNSRQLAIPDEMRYGEISREMLATGDFIVPRLNGLRYFEKPAGGHILNAAAMAIFGETNFAVRLMSALAIALSAVGLYLLLKRDSSQQTAALAAFIFLTCAEVMGVGTFSVLDSMLSCCVTLSLCSFYPALTAGGKKRIGWLALSGVFAGGAFLVKGFIAFAVPVVVIVPFLVFRRQWKDLFTMPWIPLAVAGVVSLPWALAIASKEPDFWRYFFWEEHINRYLEPGGGQHKFPFWFFVPVFLGGTLPWSLIGPLPLRDLIRQRKSEPLIQFALVWMIMPFLFFSCSSGKLGTYILPCFAPFALLLAIALIDRFERSQENRFLQVGVSLIGAIIGVSLIATLVVLGLFAFDKIPKLDENFLAKAIGWLIGLSTAFALVWRASRDRDGLQKTIMLGLPVAAIFVTGTLCSPTEISSSLGIQGFLESEKQHLQPNTLVVANTKTMHAVCYVYQREDVYLCMDQGEVAYGLSYPEAEHRFLDVLELHAMVTQRGPQRVVVVMESQRGDPLRDQLPLPTYQRQWRKIWFAVYEPLVEK
ncbi:MAG: phospholipid carrier-dependent glycosyltransferase [Planctomycetota bacterium]|nr:MAG: phospholipid carrier-dependent glycosyltransferase [Planctomycetota bacterium]